jgi:glycosyltransferase involved in cell wall biosynthesis
MNIAIIAPGLPNKGGAARFTWEFSKYLASQKDQVTIISLFSNRDLFADENNLKIIDLADKNSMTQSIKFWVNLSKIRKKIKIIINDLKPDLVFFMNFPATLWAQKFGEIPVLCYPQDINLLYTNTYIKNLSFEKYISWLILRQFIRIIDKKRWKSFDQIICNSKFSALSISKKYDVKPIVVYPGTDTKFFIPSKKNLEEKSILLMANHKTPRADFFLKSLPQLLKKRDDFKIWIVGTDKKYEYELKELVKKLNINHLTTFFGRVSDSKLQELYSKAMVLVHLQKIHPFGLVFIESMSSGTPVIACKPGATEEVIRDGETGFLIDENDSTKLIEYIERFLDDPNRSITMGSKGRDRVKNNFELSVQYEKIRKIILEHVTSKKPKMDL